MWKELLRNRRFMGGLLGAAGFLSARYGFGVDFASMEEPIMMIIGLFLGQGGVSAVRAKAAAAKPELPA